MNFPSYQLNPIEITDEIEEALGARPIAAFMGRDMLCIFEDEEIVRNMSPDLELVKDLDGLLVHISAKGGNYDCVSRSFAPKMAVDEDPVCGSGHCHILPYWTEELAKKELVAFQASARGGIIYGKIHEDRVTLGGNAALYSEATIHVGNDS